MLRVAEFETNPVMESDPSHRLSRSKALETEQQSDETLLDVKRSNRLIFFDESFAAALHEWVELDT